MLTAELGTAFPAEGGIYSWVRIAYGKLPGEITAIFYWFSNAIWIGGTLAASTIKGIDIFITPNKPLGLWPSVLIGLAFVWFNIWLSVIAFKHGKWAGNIGAWVKALAVVLFFIMVVAFLIKNGVPHGVASGSTYKPSLTGFLAVAPLVVFLYVGFELQSSASEEMTNPQRDVPVGILRSGIATSILYGIVVIGMLLALPVKQLTGVGGFLGASAAANTGLLGTGGGAKAMGYIIAIVWILALVGSGSVWTLGSCRVQALAALDGSAPRWLGKISKQGTPTAMALITGVVGSTFVAIVLGYYKGSVSSFFEVMLSLTTLDHPDLLPVDVAGGHHAAAQVPQRQASLQGHRRQGRPLGLRGPLRVLHHPHCHHLAVARPYQQHLRAQLLDGGQLGRRARLLRGDHLRLRRRHRPDLRRSVGLGPRRDEGCRGDCRRAVGGRRGDGVDVPLGSRRRPAQLRAPGVAGSQWRAVPVA